jgi:hypothetical protein
MAAANRSGAIQAHSTSPASAQERVSPVGSPASTDTPVGGMLGAVNTGGPRREPRRDLPRGPLMRSVITSARLQRERARTRLDDPGEPHARGARESCRALHRFDMLVKAEPMAAEAVRIVGVIDN